MLLKVALLLSMLIQLGAAITAISLIRRTRFNVSWILISSGFVLMTLRRLFEFSTLFWETSIISKDEVSSWIGILISILMLVGVIFIRQIFNLQDRLEEIRKGSETRLLKAVLKAEEKTRQSVARELHDGLGPILSSIKMAITAIETDRMDKTNKKIVERTCEVTDEAIVALKEISDSLSPHLLKNYGLVMALETLASQLFGNTEIQFELSGNVDVKQFNYDLEIGVYRMISELLNNSIKHGNPKKVILKIEDKGEYLGIHYTDNGCGFDQKKIKSDATIIGMGLDNIQSRVKSLNGYYYINSEPDKGVNAYIQIPFA